MNEPEQTPLVESGLSYKFQRLREKLREAIASGELAGKLPGERALAKRFHVNAKTLSKALTDLAAEGVLDRSIGRGTFVKGTAPDALAARQWLVVCDEAQSNCELVELLRVAHPALDVISDVRSLRPSFLNQFSAVIDVAAATPASFVRDLVVRNIPVVVVGREPQTFSTHAVLFDHPLAVSQVGRDLLLAGHSRLAAVEAKGSHLVVDTLRSTATRYAPDSLVEGCHACDVAAMIEAGVTAFVCQSVDLGLDVKGQLDRLGLSVPDRISVAAVGPTSGAHAVSGYQGTYTSKAEAIVRLLTDGQAGRPTTLWIAGQYVDAGTVASPSVMLTKAPQDQVHVLAS